MASGCLALSELQRACLATELKSFRSTECVFDGRFDVFETQLQWPSHKSLLPLAVTAKGMYFTAF